MKSRRTGLHFRIVLLILVVAAPAFWVIADMARRHRETQHLMARKSTADLAVVVAGHYERAVESAEHVLKAVARMDAVQKGDRTAMAQHFRDLLTFYPEYSHLAAIRPDGTLWAGALAQEPSLDVSQSAWFTRASSTRRFSVGNYEVCPASRLAILGLALPVEDSAGELRMVLVAAVSLQELARLKKRMELPLHSAVTLVDSDGTILARYPDHEAWTGRPAQKLGLPGTEGPPGALRQGTSPAGETRLYARRPVAAANSNLAVTLSVPTRHAFQSANEAMLLHMALLGAAVLLVLGLAWFWSRRLIVQPIRDIVETSRHMREGDLSARVPSSVQTTELAELAENLNQTAAALEESRRHRDEARRELDREQQLLSRIAETSPVGIMAIDPSGTITVANPRARNLLNIPPGGPDCLFNNPEWRITDWQGNPVPDEELTFPKTLCEGAPIHNQHLAVQPRGTTQRILLNINAAPIAMESGVGVVAVFEDVTGEVAAERRVRNVARFPDENPMPLIRVRLDGRILYGNRASPGMMEALGVDEYGVLAESWQERLQAIHDRGEPAEFELAADDRFFTVMAVPVVDQDYVNFYAYDVTERRQLTEQLRQSQKMEAIGQLAGGIAHDFNNIVTGIVGFSDFVMESLEPGSRPRRDMAQVKKLAERAAHLTSQLLAFSRRQALEPVALDLNTVLSQLSQMLQRIIGENIELVFDPDDEPARGNADPGQMEQVVMNLAVNARDAMPEGGRLTVRTENVSLPGGHVDRGVQIDPGEYVLLSIIDTGHGMPHDVRERVFEPFFTTKEQDKGTGLGLATAYGIVKQHKGYIIADSQPGEGTTFRIYLPRAQETETPPEKAPEEAAPPAKDHPGTVLVVDDEAPLARMAARVLREAGYRVFSAQSADEALDQARRRTPELDLLLTDVVLKHCSGVELHEKIAEFAPDVAVLFMSGYTGEALERHGALGEDYQLLQKPFAPSDLLRRVADALK